MVSLALRIAACGRARSCTYTLPLLTSVNALTFDLASLLHHHHKKRSLSPQLLVSSCVYVKAKVNFRRAVIISTNKLQPEQYG